MISFYYLLILHFIGDFWLQDRRIAENKSIKFSVMGEHCMHLLNVFLIGLLFPLWDIHKVASFVLCLYCTHFLQDTFVWRSYKHIMKILLGDKLKDFEYWKESSFYSVIGFDQMLHVATLYYLWKAFLQ